jgi:hypothetical protein
MALNPHTRDPAAQQAEAPLWSFVRLDAYEVPSVPSRSAAADAWLSLRRLFSRAPDAAETPLKQEAELRALQQVRLAHVVRPIDWAEAVDALDAAWSGARSLVKVLVGAPHGGHDQIVERWGERHGAQRIDAPAPSRLLQSAAVADMAPLPETPWVLPHLEHFYLRRTDGLALLRQLLAQAQDGSAGPGLIGCDSWAWAYLKHLWGGPLPQALTLRAFDGPRLARLLGHLVEDPAVRRLRFRNVHSGKDVLRVPRDEDVGDAVSDDIVRIAVHCRGNPGIARQYWRDSLRDEPQLDLDAASTRAGADAAAAEADAAPPCDTVWVSAGRELPALPSDAQEDTALMLHALLLHGAAPAALLPAVLPLAAHRAQALLLRLQAQAVVECRDDGRWAVAALAYPAVRDVLRARGYLTDSL